MAWSEEEVNATVKEYFKLLRADQEGETVNKRAIYRILAERFPARTVKSFELKFKNISAILYEERLPYCRGLKPRSNYQRLLRLMVLDHLHRTPLPSVEPHEILFGKLRELHERGSIPVTEKGAGRFGLAIEKALGIDQNSSKDADFMGIELKSKSDKSMQTLFSRTPSRYTQDDDKKGFFNRHAYDDTKRDRRGLYTSFGCKPDSLGFSLAVKDLVVQVQRHGKTVMEYDADRLEEALLSKHLQTAFLYLNTTKSEGYEACTVEAITFCKWPSIIRFLELITEGSINLDFTLSMKPGSGLKDHGQLWKIKSNSLDRLYLHSEAVRLGE
ncbi:MAG: MvaI/BcnI family restriction endonuclease [Planctomycetota bacterium]|nr:MvaI/BcnI family restriction endonuclease [Planctomycetota bacterium]